MLDASN
jgi:hypothetical protein